VRWLVALVVALAIPSIAVAATVEPGLYTGKKRGVSMRLRVKTTMRLDYRLRFQWRCSTRPRRSNGETRPVDLPRLRSSGRFRHVEEGRARNSRGRFRYRERIRGRVTDESARGRYSAVLRYTDGRVCKASDLAWSARRR
jgi:hypothetical protein